MVPDPDWRHPTLDRYILDLPELSDQERDFLREAMDEDLRSRKLRQIARQLYELRGITIPYP